MVFIIAIAFSGIVSRAVDTHPICCVATEAEELGILCTLKVGRKGLVESMVLRMTEDQYKKEAKKALQLESSTAVK